MDAQTAFDYFPGVLQKDLKKVCGKEFLLEEVNTTNAIAYEIYLGKFYSVSGNTPMLGTKYIYVGRVKTCRAGGCSIKTSYNSNDDSEFFDYYLLFDSNGVLQYIKIYNYQASHGQEITSKNWLKQFQGYNGDSDLVTGKNIDAISGATISVGAISFDIEHKTNLLKQIIN